MVLEIIGAESLGVRSLRCLVTLADRRIVIDLGVSLGYVRFGLPPHPLQIAVGVKVRETILHVLQSATDVVFSHFHGDHVPLRDANPYQLPVRALPAGFGELCGWSQSPDDLSVDMRQRFQDLADLMGANLRVAEDRSLDPLSFSKAVPHGSPDSRMGTLMMTRIDMGEQVFVHASDIQLLDDLTIERVIEWQPNIVLAAGPPLYLNRLSEGMRKRAWDNAMRLAQHIDTVILDHHLMRSTAGEAWLEALSEAVGKKVYCAADYMGRQRQLLEAERVRLYERMPVPDGWHDAYARGRVDTDSYLDALHDQTG